MSNNVFTSTPLKSGEYFKSLRYYWDPTNQYITGLLLESSLTSGNNQLFTTYPGVNIKSLPSNFINLSVFGDIRMMNYSTTSFDNVNAVNGISVNNYKSYIPGTTFTTANSTPSSGVVCTSSASTISGIFSSLVGVQITAASTSTYGIGGSTPILSINFTFGCVAHRREFIVNPRPWWVFWLIIAAIIILIIIMICFAIFYRAKN